jgi:hypothetical protein
MRKTILISAFAIALAGCAGGESDAEYNKLVAEAEAEIAVADKMGATWRDTEKFLEDSKAAMKEGDSEKAMKLAKKALKEAKLAQQQAKSQAGVKPWYPKN